MHHPTSLLPLPVFARRPASVRRPRGRAARWLPPLLGLLASLGAQEAPPARADSAAVHLGPDPVKLADFVVTGSNIRRAEMEKIAPMTILDADAIETRNAILPVDLLTSLPSVVNLPENETRLGSSGARGDNANLNLRNLGATGTLILINGRRMAINPMTAGLSQAVNVNQLPTQGIARIEVLRDGASAIYGSDAVGGVINYVLKDEFAGAEFSLRTNLPEAGGGESGGATLTFGSSFAGGRGRYFGTVDTLYREPTKLTDRAFSRTAFNSDRALPPFDVPGSAFDDRLQRGVWPTFRVGTATRANYLRPVNGVPTLTTVAPTRQANPEFFLDLNQFGWSSPRVRRASSFFSAEYDLNDRLTAFADFSYYRARSNMVRQPINLNAPTSDALKVLPIDHPYNPFGSAFFDPAGAPRADGAPRLVGTPSTVSLVSVTLPDLDPENVETNTNALRVAAGLKGRIGEHWTWDSTLFYNRVHGRDEAFPDVRESLLQAALNRTDASAYNPFGFTFKVQGGAVVPDRPFTNSAATVATFTEVFARAATSELASADLRASGRLLTLWAGDVQLAVGGEFRTEELADVRPPFSGENPADSGLETTNNDFLLHPPRPDVFGDRDITSFYAELVVPLVAPQQGLPLLHTLELTASGRFEHYSDFGDTTNPKLGLNWRPAPWLMLRGSYNEGFIAPSLAALFTSPRWTISAGAGEIDTYRNPVTNEGPFVQRTFFGGNPDLKAQESEGQTYGIVVDVPGVKGLSFTADYWRIERTNLLGTRSAAQIRESDDALLLAFTQEQLAAGVPINQIDLGSGTANYRGDPDVARFAPTPEDLATFAAYNAAHPTAPRPVAGRVFSLNTPFINVATSKDEGLDFGLRYALPRTPLGSFTLNSDWSRFLTSKNVIAPANVAPSENNDLGVNGVARWRGTTTLSWRRGAWSGGLGAYHIGSFQDTGATTTEATYEALGRPSYIKKHFTAGRYVFRYVTDSVTTFNLWAAHQFPSDGPGLLRGTRVRVGVTNLTDKAPPLASDQFGFNPAVHQNLVPGRTWSLEVSRKF